MIPYQEVLELELQFFIGVVHQHNTDPCPLVAHSGHLDAEHLHPVVVACTWQKLGKNQERQMFKASIFSLVVLPLASTCALAQANTMTSGRPSAALNPEQCAAIWKNAVPSDDLLAQSAAAPFIVNFTQVDKDGSGDISKSEFEDACAKGLVKNIEN